MQQNELVYKAHKVLHFDCCKGTVKYSLFITTLILEGGVKDGNGEKENKERVLYIYTLLT